MKRWTILILTGALLLSCTACGGSKKPPQNTAPLTSPVSQEAEPLPGEDAPAAPDTAPQQSFVEPILSEREDALETPLPPQASAPAPGGTGNSGQRPAAGSFGRPSHSRGSGFNAPQQYHDIRRTIQHDVGAG